MSVRCDRCRVRRSNGSVGMVRHCFACMAAMFGWRVNDTRLKSRYRFELTDDGRHVGFAEWVPDVVAARFADKAT